jgi:sulfite reductase beta subunit-like hemoprotein
VRTALRAIVERLRPGLCITPDQNILITDLDDAGPATVEELLRAHGAATVRELSLARRYSMSCPALPTCSLALTESERVFGRVVSAFEELLDTLGLADEPLTLRMTGCPNGCSRPYTADIGFVGRKPGESYNIYVGGGLAGDRLADLYAEDVPIGELTAVMRPLLLSYIRDRQAGEGFSDYYQRQLGRTARRMTLTGKEEPMQGRFPLTVLA